MKTTTKKTTANDVKKGNPFLEKIIDGIENLTNEQWEHYLKSDFNFLPKNVFTQNPYTGFNRLALLINMIFRGYKSSYYATFKQISAVGGKIKKGAKGMPLQYFNYIFTHKETSKRITKEFYLSLSADEQKQYIKFTFVNYFIVFNIDWIENIEEINFDTNIIDETADFEEIQTNENVDEFINSIKVNKGLKVKEALSNTAFYSLKFDEITMPKIKLFKSESDYYSTMFHEIIHWTGHPNRLNRLELKKASKEKEAFEELVAEMGAILLYLDFNYKDQFKNSLVYLRGWCTSTAKDKSRVETLNNAFKLSNKAVNYLKK